MIINISIRFIKEKTLNLSDYLSIEKNCWQNKKIFIGKMKILIINGSPRKHGNITNILDTMQQEAEANGAKTEIIRTCDLQVHPCTGCMNCRSKLKCVLPEDDAQLVLQKIQQADALIIGAPCYWGNIPGELKVVFDRIVYGMMGESKKGYPTPLHKGKKAILVGTCTTIYPFNILFNQSRGVIKALKEILKWSGFKIAATVEKGGTKNGKGLTDRDIKRSRRAVRKIT